MTEAYSWRLLVPAQRYVFAVEDGGIREFNRPGDLSFHRFRRYQELKAEHPVHGMIAWPNTVLLRGPRTVVIDPGLRMQGPPLLLALAREGLAPEDVDLVVNTHGHDDHVQGNAYFPATRVALHRLECPEADPSDRIWLLEGEEGRVAPGLRYVRTPGHTPGSITLMVDTAEGVVAVAGDTVGPLPGYFVNMRLPQGFAGREELLRSWERIRAEGPVVVIPGHNPPIRM